MGRVRFVSQAAASRAWWRPMLLLSSRAGGRRLGGCPALPCPRQPGFFWDGTRRPGLVPSRRMNVRTGGTCCWPDARRLGPAGRSLPTHRHGPIPLGFFFLV